MTEEEFKALVLPRDFRAERTLVRACGKANALAGAKGLLVVWPVQEATWGRFLVLADPDGRSVVLARMRPVTQQ